jgi:hypothetical protein
MHLSPVFLNLVRRVSRIVSMRNRLTIKGMNLYIKFARYIDILKNLLK